MPTITPRPPNPIPDASEPSNRPSIFICRPPTYHGRSPAIRASSQRPSIPHARATTGGLHAPKPHQARVREREEERREEGRRRGIGARRDDPSEPLVAGRSSALNREHARSATTRLRRCLHRVRPAPCDLAVKPAMSGASSSRATTGTPRPRSHGSASSPGIDTTLSRHPPHLHHDLHKRMVSHP